MFEVQRIILVKLAAEADRFYMIYQLFVLHTYKKLSFLNAGDDATHVGKSNDLGISLAPQMGRLFHGAEVNLRVDDVHGRICTGGLTGKIPRQTLQSPIKTRCW